MWLSVLDHYSPGKTIYAVIYGYRDGEFTSGPYFSKRVVVWSDSKHHTGVGVSEENNNVNHWISCACGYSGYENHYYYKYNQFNTNQHIRECIICGYTKPEYHGEYTYTSYSSTSHKCICKCGYERFSAHKVKSGGGLIQRCVDCGALVNLNDNFGQIQSVGNGITYITDNGSFVRSDGIIVLSEIDYLLYINGELDIDSLISQGGMTH